MDESKPMVLRKIAFYLIGIAIAEIFGLVVAILIHQTNLSLMFIFYFAFAYVFYSNRKKQIAIVGPLVTFLLLVFLSSCLLVFLLSPISIVSIPLGYDIWAAKLTLTPVTTILSLIQWIAEFCLAILIFRSILSDEYKLEMEIKNIWKSTYGIATGIGLVGFIGVTLIFSLVNNGPDASKAVSEARGKFGDAYKYSISSINYANNVVVAEVNKFNQTEMGIVQITWEK